MDLTIITILFTCLGENTEKYITFTVPIENEVTKIDKNGEEITKNMSYILQFIDSTRFMETHYQILSIIFLEEFMKLNVNTGLMKRNMKLLELHMKYATVFSNTQTSKMI